MKYKSIVLILTVMLITLFSCKNEIRVLNILTDDPSLFEIIDEFSAVNNVIINIDLVKLKKETNVFKYYIENKLYEYDIVIGRNYSDTIIDSNNFIRLTDISENIKNQNENFNLVYDHLKNNDFCSVLYRMDFPVIYARNEIKNYFKDNLITLSEFTELAKKFNNIKNDKKGAFMQIGYSPLLSYYREIDYYFIFNSQFHYDGVNYDFKSDNAAASYEFYNAFDEKNNFGIKNTRDYLAKIYTVNHDLYLRKKIIYLDINPVSFSLKDNEYKILLLKDLQNAGLNCYAAAVQKKTNNKKNSMDFIDFLLRTDNQKKIYEQTLLNAVYYNEVFYPVKKGIVRDFINESVSYDDYADNLKSVNFYNFSLQKKFFDKYYRLKEKVNTGLISENNFISILSKELND